MYDITIIHNQILNDLIAEGYTGQNLLIEFKSRQSKIRPAVEKLLNDAEEAVYGIGEHYSYSDVFEENSISHHS